jgi:type IV pilus assembly protein PilN
MIYINLLPVRQIKQKAAARQQIVAIFIAFLVLLSILILVEFFQLNKIHQFNDEISVLNAEKQKHAATLRLIKRLEKDKALIEKQISIVKQLKKSSSLTVHILDEIASLTPTERMWLTSLSQNGTSLRISGMALDNRTIAQFMEDLKSSPYITDINLTDTSLRDYAGRHLKAFSLTCTVTANVEKAKTQEKK